MDQLNLTNMFVTKEAFSSVAIDSQPDSQVTMQMGFLSNPKLYDINVKITNKKTDQIVWQGSVAQVSNHFGRF